ncbi:MAG: RluA family pseudouridine synthase [Pseudomonadota bacterium]
MSGFNKVRYITVLPEQAGQRIDNFLIRELKGVPKSRIYRILRKGEVRVNKSRTKPSYKLQGGDSVRIPPINMASSESAGVAAESAKAIEQSVIHEDKHWIGLDKPAGMAVHGGSGLSFGVIEALRTARPDAPYLELVHRLDRGTSGCLLIAKRRSALRRAHEALREHEAEKEYFVFTRPGWREDKQIINEPLLLSNRRNGERHVEVHPDGKPAVSEFRLVQRYKSGDLLRVKILTGRTHQIRVHAASVGCPVAGDDRYGDDSYNQKLKQRGLTRLFLHASSLRLVLEDDEEIHIHAPLPDMLNDFLRGLELKRGRV